MSISKLWIINKSLMIGPSPFSHAMTLAVKDAIHNIAGYHNCDTLLSISQSSHTIRQFSHVLEESKYEMEVGELGIPFPSHGGKVPDDLMLGAAMRVCSEIEAGSAVYLFQDDEFDDFEVLEQLTALCVMILNDLSAKGAVQMTRSRGLSASYLLVPRIEEVVARKRSLSKLSKTPHLSALNHTMTIPALATERKSPIMMVY